MDEVTKLADQLKHKAKDYCDKPYDPLAEQLQKNLEQLHGQMRLKITPDKLLYKVKDIRTLVEDMKRTEGIETVYDMEHLDDIHDRLEDIRKELEQLRK